LKGIYASPLRVYIALGFLACVGIFAGAKLPISLFPNSSKPKIAVHIPFGALTSDEFLNLYGRNLESSLQSISTDETPIEKLEASYAQDRVNYTVQFGWGTNSELAKKEVEQVVNTVANRFPDEMRLGTGVWPENENSGFVAISFYSDTRSLDNLYSILEPILVPKLSKIPDAANAELWNPTRKEVRVELQPEKMAALQLFPNDISHAISAALTGEGGGSVTVGVQQLSIQMPRTIRTPEDLEQVLIPTPSGRIVHLGDTAKVDYTLRGSDSKSIKTSGAPSLILFAEPKPGGNVKNMAEGVINVVKEAALTLPKDIRYEILVDPSEFINSAIANVMREVAMGACLAVLVLFLFIGSLRNTITAAIEIPLSMVLAFILMRMSGMNLNLISLGGLALSAGMNVDASVVVMENIFRHFDDHPGEHSYDEKLAIILKAVSEVKFAVIASTISSLVVFIPLAFTSDLSYAVLGDLAKTVVFSHGFSAFVALILVPTVRLQLMSKQKAGHVPTHSPIEPQIQKLESFYADKLASFIQHKKTQNICYASLAVLLLLMTFFILPTLPKDIIGTPDTDWIYVGINTRGNTLVKQMESTTEEIEARFLKEFGTHIRYTFTQINAPNQASIMARLKDKGEMKAVWKKMELFLANTPFVKYYVGPWNPAELPIPDPPQIQITVRGGELKDRVEATREIENIVEEHEILPRVWTDPNVDRSENIVLRPNLALWSGLKAANVALMPTDLADLSRVATNGRRVDSLLVNGQLTEIFLRYPDGMIQTPEDLGALPVGVDSKIIPLRALVNVQTEDAEPSIYRLDQREIFNVYAKLNQSDKGTDTSKALQSAHEYVDGWSAKWLDQKEKSGVTPPSIYFEDAEIEIHTALKQLGNALGISILLIFLTLLLQFGDVVNALLVLVAVPLGLIGALGALFVFRSTLSLNSILGVILLNGIAVANSIILVDFMKRLVDQGQTPAEAAVTAARKRLRPILITSLTTILGMLPIALGLGEGGKVLQPLGITVSGGLWVSMTLTLFIVPALQVKYLNWKMR
jgi:HAE1 family hydrophobic/amphiphilic exporter-1